MSATVSLQQLTDQLDQLEADAAEAIAAAATAAELEELRVGLLGKKGRLSAVLGATSTSASKRPPSTIGVWHSMQWPTGPAR